MRKDEFLNQLEYLLQDIPEADRKEAMEYYRDYLAEAGSENEEQVIEEFGSPERVAAIIRADVTGNMREGGFFTESGFEDERFRDPNFQVAKRLDLPDEREEETSYQYRDSQPYEEAEYRECYESTVDSKAEFKEKKQKPEKKSHKNILWAILLIIASPIILMVGGFALVGICCVAGIAIGAVLYILGLTVAAFVLSVCIGAFGLAFIATTPLNTVFLLGIAICGIGCGLFGAVCLYVLLGICVPYLWTSCGKLIRFLSDKGKEKKTA